MQLSGSESRELRIALTEAYPSKTKLSMLVRESDLDTNLEEIVIGENLNEIAFQLINWAESQNKLNILISAACQENPGNLKLQAFIEKLQQKQQLQTFSFEVVTVNSYGAITKRETKSAQYFTQNLFNNITLDMVTIPSGTFLMGAPESEEGSSNSQRPQHEVTVQPFFIGKYPITQAQWRAVATLPQINRTLQPEPSHFKGDNLPVEQISWYDAVEFCDRLSQYSGRNYRLPSETEWEYACRAETYTPFYSGETITTELANFDGNYTYADSKKNLFLEQTSNVGAFPPNNFGLYDMHGNVWEWCFDDWHDDYNNAPPNSYPWITSITNSTKLLRGGAWLNQPRYCRSAYRLKYEPNLGLNYMGLRVVCSNDVKTF